MGVVPAVRRRHCPGNAATTYENAPKTPAALTAKTPRFGLQITGGSARGYLGFGEALNSPGMTYWMVTCSVYSYIVIFGAIVRFCRIQREQAGQSLTHLTDPAPHRDG
jgi:hypothetical protein